MQDENFSNNQQIGGQAGFVGKGVCERDDGRNVRCSRTESNGNRKRQIRQYAVYFVQGQ